jgi:hypothetical protein
MNDKMGPSELSDGPFGIHWGLERKGKKCNRKLYASKGICTSEKGGYVCKTTQMYLFGIHLFPL